MSRYYDEHKDHPTALVAAVLTTLAIGYSWGITGLTVLVGLGFLICFGYKFITGKDI